MAHSNIRCYVERNLLDGQLLALPRRKDLYVVIPRVARSICVPRMESSARSGVIVIFGLIDGALQGTLEQKPLAHSLSIGNIKNTEVAPLHHRFADSRENPRALPLGGRKRLLPKTKEVQDTLSYAGSVMDVQCRDAPATYATQHNEPRIVVFRITYSERTEHPWDSPRGWVVMINSGSQCLHNL